MADYCMFCNKRKPKGGTKILITDSTEWWEFCNVCGDSEIFVNDLGERKTIAEIYESAKEVGDDDADTQQG